MAGNPQRGSVVKFWSSSGDEASLTAAIACPQNPDGCHRRRAVAKGDEASRVNRTQEVAGSSPASSTKKRPAQGVFLFSGLATKSCETAAWSSFGQVAAKALIAPRRVAARFRVDLLEQVG